MIRYRYRQETGSLGKVLRPVANVILENGIIKVEVSLKEATFTVDNKRLKTRIAWALVENVPLIIGRMDIFNQFRITFDEKKGWIDFED